MFADSSYKISFIFALVLHAVLVTFLLIKFTQAKPVGFSGTSIIHATAINLNSEQLSGSRQQTVPKQESLATASKPQVLPAKTPAVPVLKTSESVKTAKNNLLKILKKDFLKTQSQELDQLKKEQQKYVKNITEQKEQQLLQQSLIGTGSATNQDSVEQGGQMSGEFDKYKSAIVQVINSNWHKPLGLTAGEFCMLEVDVAPGGVVIDVKPMGIADNQLLERSAQAAVFKSSPLPGAEDPEFFDAMRKLRLRFGAEGISVAN